MATNHRAAGDYGLLWMPGRSQSSAWLASRVLEEHTDKAATLDCWGMMLLLVILQQESRVR